MLAVQSEGTKTTSSLQWCALKTRKKGCGDDVYSGSLEKNRAFAKWWLVSTTRFRGQARPGSLPFWFRACAKLSARRWGEKIALTNKKGQKRKRYPSYHICTNCPTNCPIYTAPKARCKYRFQRPRKAIKGTPFDEQGSKEAKTRTLCKKPCCSLHRLQHGCTAQICPELPKTCT